MAVEYKCCGTDFFIDVLIIVLLVMFAGLMSGLTLGLMSMSIVDLEVLAQSGTPKDRKHAALPIFLDNLVTAWGAILISVTLILVFGEIIPQSVCSRYGLAIGAKWLHLFVFLSSGFLLGHGHVLFRRAELKTLVNFHGNEAGKGGELTHDETTIIAGALELSEKTVGDAMTPISETFAIDINAKLDKYLMNLVLEKGHSRVPVYHEQPTNIIGLILVKNLLTIHPEDVTPVKNVTIRRIPEGHSHMAVVVRQCNKTEEKTTGDAVVDVKE
ncbi:hypothetical protein GH714_030513 [Hevea brasiliensis]|uniref:CNNM transmembrane domain-containing protein n=1 Tax=Hevea brasiliensis TaxID=3981 RepID=A0A6A6N3I9_HEVBR|nr:hypothetical protein GH714_030513 [Hevea brasiliensis]